MPESTNLRKQDKETPASKAREVAQKLKGVVSYVKEEINDLIDFAEKWEKENEQKNDDS